MAKDTRFWFGDGQFEVRVGNKTPDWKLAQFKKVAMDKFGSTNIRITKESGVNVSGESTMRTSF